MKTGECDICGKSDSYLVQCGDHWHFACTTCAKFIVCRDMTPDKWTCDTCGTTYAEYVNGCPHCETVGIRSRVESAPAPQTVAARPRTDRHKPGCVAIAGRLEDCTCTPAPQKEKP